MAATAIAEVKAAMLSGLEAVDALRGVRISYGVPVENLPSEMIVLGNATSDQEAVSLGNTRRRETTTLTVYVDVARESTKDQKATTERAVTISDSLEQFCRDNPKLTSTFTGDAELLWLQFSGIRGLEEFSGSNTRRALLTCEITYQARL